MKTIKLILALCLALALCLTAAAEGELTCTVRENTENINLREAPGTDSAVVAKLASGSPLTLLSVGEWCYVKQEDTGLEGCVLSEYLELPLDGSLSIEPVKALDLNVNAAVLTIPGNYACDLDGDGETENLYLFEFVLDDFERSLCVRVEDAAGHRRDIVTDIRTAGRAYLVPLEGGGCAMLLSGDVMSDDYVTYAWTKDKNDITAIPFVLDENGTFPIDAALVGAQGRELTLSMRFDLFGTRFASRPFETAREGIAPAPHTVWDFGGVTEEEFDLLALTLQKDLYTAIDGSVVRLAKGERLIITSVSESLLCTFVTEDGREGTFTAEEMSNGTHSVNGTPEDELFLGMQYAD